MLCEQLLGERPTDAPLRTILADTHRTLGCMDWDARRLDRAEAHLDAALGSLERARLSALPRRALADLAVYVVERES